jgi:hypothetical protein
VTYSYSEENGLQYLFFLHDFGDNPAVGERTGEDENESMDLVGMGGLVSVDVKKQSCVLDTYAWFSAT